MKWREEYEADTLTTNFVFTEEKEVKSCYPFGFFGVDKIGRPIIITLIG